MSGGGGTTCPACGSGQMRPLPTRTKWELWRRTLTGKRLFRCSDCKRHSWTLDQGPTHRGPVYLPEPGEPGAIGLGQDRRSSLDLTTLDRVSDRSTDRLDSDSASGESDLEVTISSAERKRPLLHRSGAAGDGSRP
jgi:hypothetical protein